MYKMSNENLNQVMDINPMIDYQKDAVVSRTLIKMKTGSITMFAFDKDQALSEHTAPFDALVHVIEGKVEVTINGKSNTVQTGQLIIIPANEPHALYAIEKFKMILTMIKDVN